MKYLGWWRFRDGVGFFWRDAAGRLIARYRDMPGTTPLSTDLLAVLKVKCSPKSL